MHCFTKTSPVLLKEILSSDLYNTCAEKFNEVKYNPDKCSEMWNDAYPDKDYDYLYIDFEKYIYTPSIQQPDEKETPHILFYQKYKCYFRGMKKKLPPWFVPTVISYSL